MPYPKDFDPTVHEFKPRPRGFEDGKCNNCHKPVHHHFHTGVFGKECGCMDCLPLDVWINETHALAKATRPRWFSRFMNR